MIVESHHLNQLSNQRFVNKPLFNRVNIPRSQGQVSLIFSRSEQTTSCKFLQTTGLSVTSTITIQMNIQKGRIFYSRPKVHLPLFPQLLLKRPTPLHNKHLHFKVINTAMSIGVCATS
jgi:hypothetical protein